MVEELLVVMSNTDLLMRSMMLRVTMMWIVRSMLMKKVKDQNNPMGSSPR